MELSRLRDPFHPNDIEWRIQQSGLKGEKPWGMCLAYVTNRAIMERLDDICGPENWQNVFRDAPDGGVLCGIAIRCYDGDDQWVTKWDGAPNTDIEAVKGGLSNAMKRAAVQWGIGRYLYKLETGWAVFTDKGKYSAKMKNNKYYKWNPPALPEWALPHWINEQPKKSNTFLDKMKGYAKNEPEIYKKVLAGWNIKSATEVTKKEGQDTILLELENELRRK